MPLERVETFKQPSKKLLSCNSGTIALCYSAWCLALLALPLINISGFVNGATDVNDTLLKIAAIPSDARPVLISTTTRSALAVATPGVRIVEVLMGLPIPVTVDVKPNNLQKHEILHGRVPQRCVPPPSSDAVRPASVLILPWQIAH